MKEPLRRWTPLVRLAVSLVLALPLWGGSLAYAQLQPQISYIFPPGGQRGTTVEVKVRGRNLVGATQLHLSGKGVAGAVTSAEQQKADPKQPVRLDVARYPDVASIAVTVAADAEVGEHDLRIITPGGVSNRFRFFVGEVPEVNEVEPNSSLAECQVLPALPVVVNGQSFQADRDFFRFQAKAGKRWCSTCTVRRSCPTSPMACPAGTSHR